MPLWFAGVVFVIGFICGHNWLWARCADDMAIMAKIRREAGKLKLRARFLNEDYICQYVATYSDGDDKYQLTLEPMWLRLANTPTTPGMREEEG